MNFDLREEQLDLPKGAFARGYRRILWSGEKPVVGFTQGPFRPYLYPVYTPSGIPVTTESPADHPHHNSIWIATDHVHALRPIAGDRHEEATYCFYVNEVFQGRAPGTIVERNFNGEQTSSDHYRVVQRMSWIGPGEWGAATGREVAIETRTTDIRLAQSYYTIDIHSELGATDWQLRIGPTRHAYFGVRVIESMREISGGIVSCADNVTGAQSVSGSLSSWIDYSGPVGGGRVAGIAMLPGRNASTGRWFVTDWGTVAINPFESDGHTIATGESEKFDLRMLVHDDELNPETISDQQAAFLQEMEKKS